MTTSSFDFAQLEYNAQGLASAILPGPVGAVEAVLSVPAQLAATTPIALICHPHPLHGGSLTNKVVHTLARTYAESGAITLRFNFRGVGQSQGEYTAGEGESQDVLSLLALLRDWRPQAPLWLAGFSFGAYVALRSAVAAAPELQPEHLVLVAPPVNMYDFSALSPSQHPWLVIQGGQDEISEPAAVKAWLERQSRPPQLAWYDEAEHFFHGKLNLLKQAMLDFLNKI